MENPLGAIVDQDLARLLTAIGGSYQEGTLQFLEEHFPSFREKLDLVEERVGRLHDDLLAGQVILAEWRAALDELRSLWELAGQLRREYEEQGATRVAEIGLVTAEA